MSRHKPTKAPPSVALLIAELRANARPSANLLTEARRALAARDKAGQHDEDTAELREAFERRLSEALRRKGRKPGSLLNVARLYETDKGEQGPAPLTKAEELERLGRITLEHYPNFMPYSPDGL